MYDRQSPIGILDSGIGGFSVVRQVQQLLPVPLMHWICRRFWAPLLVMILYL